MTLGMFTAFNLLSTITGKSRPKLGTYSNHLGWTYNGRKIKELVFSRHGTVEYIMLDGSTGPKFNGMCYIDD